MSGKRFYKAVSLARQPEAGLQLLLDGKPVQTPAKRPLDLPSLPLAEAVADEWRAQGDEVLPETMPLTRIANSAIDGVAERRDAVIDDILSYAASDLLCYRAEGPERLGVLQGEAWDPVLDWARQHFGARFNLAQGIVHVAQPPEALARLRDALAELDPFALAALHVMTGLTGSALLSLAVLERRLSAEEAWRAAHVDEDWQIGQWGEDAEAAARRTARFADYGAAAEMLRLLEA